MIDEDTLILKDDIVVDDMEFQLSQLREVNWREI